MTLDRQAKAILDQLPTVLIDYDALPVAAPRQGFDAMAAAARAALVAGLALLGAVDASGVDRPTPQVTIETKFVEVARKDVRGLGIDWSGLEPSAQPLDPAKLPVLGALMKAEAGAGGVLATPETTARAGQPVDFQVGDPARVAVVLRLLSGVAADGRLILKVQVEVAQPGLSKLLDTKLAVPDGQSVAIGGLFTDQTREAARGVPGLGGVPVLGKLFADPSFQGGERDLLILITPHLVGEEGSRRGGPPAGPVFQPRPDPELSAPSVPKAPHQPTPGYGQP